MEELRQKIDEIVERLKTETEEITEEIQIELQKFSLFQGTEIERRVEEIRDRIRKEVGDMVADIVGYLLNALLNLIVIGGGGFGFGWGLFDAGRVLGQRYALSNLLLYIPSPQETYDLLHRGLLSESEAEQYLKEHGISEYFQRILRIATQPRVTPEQIRELYRRKFISADEAFRQLKLHGYDTVQASLILGLAYDRLPPETAIRAWLRGLISEQELDQLLEISGYFGKDLRVLKELAFYIPSISDLIRMAVREAFNPEAIRTFQLDMDYPEELTKWAQAQGLSRDWAMKYWIAHWELPSLTQGFEMFHRTIRNPVDPNADAVVSPFGETRYNVIGRETLRMLMKAQDISPFWRDKLEQISYLPLTRVDVRRAYDLGIINENDVYFTYRDLGYNHENATILTEFTILETISEERNRVRNELIELYEEGAITKEELHNALIGLRYNQRAIEILLEYAEFRKIRKRIERYKRYFKALYMRGDIDEDGLHDRLVRLGLESDEVIALLDEWRTEKIAKERTLTKSEIEQAFRKRVISEQKAREKLARLGYSDEDIDILIATWRV